MVRPRRRRGARLVAYAALPALVLTGCTIENPELPTFESEWLIPLGTLDKTVLELIEDEPDFVVGEDGTISLTTSGELDAVGVGRRLDVEVGGIDFSAEIGPIRLDATAPLGFSHRLGELYPAADALDGLDVLVPAFDFDLDSPPQDLPGFRTATLASGGLEVDVQNGLPVPVGASSGPQQLVIRLFDPTDDSTIVDFVVAAPIAPGGSFSDLIDLSGRTLPDSVGVRLTGGSPGSGASTATIDASSELSVQVRTTALEVLTAVASFGAQSFEDVSSVTLPDSVKVIRATVDDGDLVVSLRNDLPVPAQADIVIAAFVDAQRRPLTLSVPLPPGSTAQRQVDLRAYTLDFGDGTPGTSLDVVAQLSTPGSAGADVSIRATDVVSVRVEPLRLEFGAVTGILDPIEITIDPSTTSIEIPEDLEDMRLQTAELVLGFRSTLGMPITVDLHLEGTNASGVMVPLDTSIDLPAVVADQAQNFARTLDRDNSSIVDFLNNLPTDVSFRGTARVGDGVTIGTVAVDDSVSARWSMIAPMTIAVQPQTIEPDAERLDLDDDLRTQLQERLIELTLEARVSSTLPIAAIAYVGIDTDSTSVFSAPDLELGPIEIPAAGPVGPGGLRSAQTVISQILVARDDIPLITRPGTWTGLRLAIPGTDGRFVSLRATDAVEVRGFLRARILIGEVD